MYLSEDQVTSQRMMLLFIMRLFLFFFLFFFLQNANEIKTDVGLALFHIRFVLLNREQNKWI